MAEGKKFDANLFNTDPKHAEQREFLDAINEASMQRIVARKKKENPEDDAWDFFDFLKPSK